ncbi:hypothetical protein HUJ04_000836 [Dendroctonus ponderosae]|nr:hypothetical protein HUJ04_000836 [Dendroctonus ponderosae]
MDYSVDLILKYPLINIKSTEKSDIVRIHGKIYVHHKYFAVTLHQITHLNGAPKYKLKSITNVKSKSTLSKIKNALSTDVFRNIVEVLDQMNEILLQDTDVKHLEVHTDIYRKVIHEYSEFVKFFLNISTCELKEDLTTICVAVTGATFPDSKPRLHSVEIAVDYSKKSSDLFRISAADLPEKDQAILKGNESLIALFDTFIGQLELLQPYFELMDTLDEHATILDPDKPRKSDAYRRIWLGENISTIITVDPFNIYERPDIKFLGPDRLIESFSSSLNENIGKWVYQENIFQGILDLLGLQEFPKKDTATNQVNLLVEFGECSICFCLRLNNKLPEIICTNQSCEKLYHNQCLYDWLVSLHAKRVFNNISGNCPNCEKTISCPLMN